MLENLMNDLITKLQETQTFKQIEPYEGQFEDFSEYTLVPPAAFIELSDGEPNPNGRQNTILTSIAIYVTTNHIKGKKPSSILNIIDMLRDSLNKQIIGKGILKFNGFRRLGIFPGFITYQINFIHNQS